MSRSCLGTVQFAWIAVILTQFMCYAVTGYGLKCYVGLGNNAQRRKQKVVQCPDEKYYVCMKMYGGGMGDQIRRKCQKVTIPEFEDLLEIEAEREQKLIAGEYVGENKACFETVDHGRKAFVCLCSTDMCNAGIRSAPTFSIAAQLAWAAVALGVSPPLAGSIMR